MSHAVVVGIDGSAQSEAAAEWAAYEAYRSGRPLRMIHVAGTGRDAAENGLPQSVAAIRDRVASVLPGLEASCEQVPGIPTYALAAAGEREGLLVLGSRGLGGFTGLLVGSVGLRTAAHARCPVVLVRAAGPVADPRGAVVVGVEGDRPSAAVLGFAFEQADRLGVVLRAMESRTLPYGPYATDAPVDQREIEESLAAAELLRLQDALAPWREKYPEVRTEVELAAWGPARTLVEASHSASLVVLGRRAPAQPMAAPRLGFVAHAVLHHADSPVAVVPHD